LPKALSIREILVPTVKLTRIEPKIRGR
jgi:hypothetical protein